MLRRHARLSRIRDAARVAVFSLVIYYWALAVGLPTEEINEMIEEVVLPEEEGLAAVSH